MPTTIPDKPDALLGKPIDTLLETLKNTTTRHIIQILHEHGASSSEEIAERYLEIDPEYADEGAPIGLTAMQLFDHNINQLSVLDAVAVDGYKDEIYVTPDQAAIEYLSAVARSVTD
jgi:hypothetical protein